MEDMPEAKGVAFQATMTGLKPALDAAGNLTPETVELTKEFVAENIALYRAQERAAKAEAFAAQMGGIFGGFFKNRDSGGAQSGKKEVVLELNDREFGRAVIDAIEGKYNLKTE